MPTNKSQAKNKSVAIRVINILFIVAVVVAAIVAILMFTPVSSSLKASLQGKDWAVKIVQKLNNWVYWHVTEVFHVSTTFRGHGKTFTSCFYVFLLALIGVFCLFLIYLPFLFMHDEKKKGKTQTWRKVLCWLTFAGITICTLGAFSLLYSNKLSNMMGSAYTWILTLGHKWCRAFLPGHKLNILVIERITSNHTIWAALWLGFFITLVEVIVLVITEIGKAKEAKPIADEKAVAEVKDEAVKEDGVAPAPVMAEASTEDKLEPTIREIAVLNSLNPLYETKIETLPDLDDIPSEEELEKDLATENDVVTEESKENKVAVDQANEIAESTSPFEKAITVLPGIDEWDADPWPEEEDDVVEAKKETVEEKVAESATEDKAMVEEEAKKEEVEEKVEEPIIDNSDTKENDLTEVAAPVQEDIPVEESAAHAEDKTEEEKAEEIIEEKVEEEASAVEEEKEVSHVTAINTIFHDGLRQQEETNEVIEDTDKSDRSEKKEVVANNDHKDIITAKADDKDTWDIGTYVPEEKKEEAPIENNAEEQKVEEKKDEPVVEESKPVQPTPHINAVGLKQFDPSKRNNRPTGPIGVIKPIKKEEVVEEKPVEEKKPVIAPISGPLHSTEKSKHEKIEAVKARHVAFALKNYEVKTYEGDLTAEEAFSMGVTKVQPTVNPVFANQGKEPAWKEKRRQENIRKNGYGDVTTVDKLNGKPAASAPVSSSKKSFSIRDMAKSKKAAAENETVTAPTEEKKISKPITPVSFKPVEAPKVQEEKKETTPFEAENPAPNFRPIAPIQHKDRKRPEIKPVDPMKGKK